MRPIIAIDPGALGGLVYWDEDVVTSCKMPKTPGDVLDWLTGSIALHAKKPVVYLEQVSGYAGGKGQPGSAMFNFGMGYGFIQGVVMTLGLELHLVTPQTWQKALRIGSKGSDSKTDWKNKLKAAAQRLYPTEKVTLNTADALLILNYARQQERA